MDNFRVRWDQNRANTNGGALWKTKKGHPGLKGRGAAEKVKVTSVSYSASL